MAAVILTASDRLWLVFLPGFLGAFYALGNLRRTRYVARFTNVELTDVVLPRGPGWRRHVPAMAVLGALGIMAVGLAHPSLVHQIPRRQGLVVLAVDVSPSMMATDVSPTREVEAQREASKVLTGIPVTMQVALVSFAGTAVVEVPPTFDHQAVQVAIGRLGFRSYTSYNAAITTILAMIGSSANGSPAGVVMVSDGCPCIGQGSVRKAAITQANQDHVPISVIVVGTPRGVVNLERGRLAVPVDAATLEQIAAGTGGQTYLTPNRGALDTAARNIGAAVGLDLVIKDLSGWFFAVAFGLVLIGATLSLAWFARIP